MWPISSIVSQNIYDTHPVERLHVELLPGEGRHGEDLRSDGRVLRDPHELAVGPLPPELTRCKRKENGKNVN